MKRKVMTIGLAMLAGLPATVLAKSGGKDGRFESQAYGSWNSAYSPHYEGANAAHPLMDHFNSPVVQNKVNKNWRLEMAPPGAGVSSSDEALVAREKPIGLSLKLTF